MNTTDRSENPAASGVGSGALFGRLESATAIFSYRKEGRDAQWSIGCMAYEPESDLRAHFAKWMPGFELLKIEVIPDKPNAGDEPRPTE